ncbi:MAG: hypothetical protein Q7U39_01240 [Nitrospira sp.]|nr:hypothetical protein [Nitrospira sp.]
MSGLISGDQGKVPYALVEMHRHGPGTHLFGRATPGQAQEPAAVMTTIRGVLISIKGDVYLMQDLSGRFVTFHADANTQRQRLVVPGERIEVQVSTTQRAISIKPAQ